MNIHEGKGLVLFHGILTLKHQSGLQQATHFVISILIIMEKKV